MARLTVTTIKEKKARRERISMVTAYDYPSARLAEEAGLDLILVGDSVGTTIMGYDTTLPVTMEEMLYHTRLVTRGAPQTFVIGDMPFMSYHLSAEQALANAGKFLQEAGAQAVKLEGGTEKAEVVRAIVTAGIPVLGHLGLTPQSVHRLGGYKVQGKTTTQARKILDDAKALEEAGAFAIVLECVPAPLSKLITESLAIPTIGIGAGVHCDGQVLVWHDLLGLTIGPTPRFVKQYSDLKVSIIEALKSYRQEVAEGKFPGEEHSYKMNSEDLPKIDP